MSSEEARRRGELPALEGTLTQRKLSEAFARDSQAIALYTYFARIAEIEGHLDAARTLRELAEAQVLMADGHLDFLKRVADPLTGARVGSTAMNLQAALGGETVDAGETLPGMAEIARNEGFPDIASWFESVALGHSRHAERLAEVLATTRESAR